MSTGDSARPAARRLALPGDWRPALSAGRHGLRRGSWRAWRRSRPFGGGVLLLLAGVELVLIPLSGVLAHGAIKLTVYIGIGGVFGVLIGILLITAGIALWADPAHRTFYSVAGVVLGILSFPASNLGGFFLCMLLAVVGGSLAFAWTPVTVPPAQPEPATPGPPTPDPPTPDPPTPDPPTPDPPTLPDAGTSDPGHGTAMLAVAAPLIVATGLLIGLPAAHAHPASSAQICILGICLGDGSSSSPSASPSTSSPACLPTSLPTALPTSLPTSSPTGLPECVSSLLPTSLPTLPVSLPAPAVPGLPLPSAQSGPGKGGDPKSAQPKSSSAGAGLVAPAAISVITAGSATMVHFLYKGNVKMPTAAGGTVTMMKFTADSLTLSGGSADAVTEAGHTAITSSPVMAFSGNVVLYATRLSGRLGDTPLTLTPTSITTLALPGLNLVTGNITMTLTSVTTDQAMGTADSLTYGPGGQGFSVVLH